MLRLCQAQKVFHHFSPSTLSHSHEDAFRYTFLNSFFGTKMWHSLILRELVLGIPDVIRSVPVKVLNLVLTPISGSYSQVRGLRSGRLAREQLQREQFCVRFTTPLWQNKSWDRRLSSRSTAQSLFLPSPVVTKGGSWPMDGWNLRR